MRLVKIIILLHNLILWLANVKIRFCLNSIKCYGHKEIIYMFKSLLIQPVISSKKKKKREIIS